MLSLSFHFLFFIFSCALWGWDHRQRNGICIYINNAHAVWKKGPPWRAQCLEMVRPASHLGLLRKLKNAFYLYGHQSLLSIFTSVPSFELHSNPGKLAEWVLVILIFANEEMMLRRKHLDDRFLTTVHNDTLQ